jgi:hypothetical protein
MTLYKSARKAATRALDRLVSSDFPVALVRPAIASNKGAATFGIASAAKADDAKLPKNTTAIDFLNRFFIIPP